MTDRYHGYVPTPSGRSPTFNPARASMPTSVGYSSIYAGDMHVMPSASYRHHITPRGYTTSNTNSGPTTARTYAYNQDPRASSKTRDGSRTRRSTLDSTSRPVIVTTTQLDRPHAASSHSSNARTMSPIRDDYRASDGQLYSQPASSIRSRSSARPYHVSNSSADYGRYRGRAESHLSSRDLEAYRNSRPSVVYPSDPRHSNAAIDYGDDGYQYTNAGELVKYDLEQTKPKSRHRRHDSVDTGYYRPNINGNADRRSLNATANHDLNRNYHSSSQPYESRGGPPPTTRGFEKISRGHDSRDVPPAAPVPPSPTTSSKAQLDVPGASGGRRTRPLSLHQDNATWSSHHQDYYRSREDERAMRELRDHDRDRSRNREHDRHYDTSRFHDESVASRGFGIRTELADSVGESRDRRRDNRTDGPRKRSDEDIPYGSDREKRHRHRDRQGAFDDRRDQGSTRRVEDEEIVDNDPSRSYNTLATGLGAVATATGLRHSSKPMEERTQSSSEPKRRETPPEDRVSHRDVVGHDYSPSFQREGFPAREKDSIRETVPLRQKEPAWERDPITQGEPSRKSNTSKDPTPTKEAGSVREREDVRNGETAREKELLGEDIKASPKMSGSQKLEPSSGNDGEIVRAAESDSNNPHRSSRQERSANTFDPNDTSDLKQLKEQLATMEVSDGRGDRDLERLAAAERQRTRSPTPVRDQKSGSPSQSQDEHWGGSRGRELVEHASESEGKQVRLVSPPRDRSDGRPIKGILKQPKASFPEEANPVREGVAPHKEDKKLKEAPPGARWTKINRKIVNPEALTIGKERFEVRDDFVIVLRVLSKEEIQSYAAATQVLRERRRHKHQGNEEWTDDRGKGHTRDQDHDEAEEDAERRQRHRRHREGPDDDVEVRDQERDKEKNRDRDRDFEREGEKRKQRTREDADGYDDTTRDATHHRRHHHDQRSYRDRERDLESRD